MKAPNSINSVKTTLNLLAAGLFLAATNSALATVRYVWQSSPGPTPPYTNWATAATNIQDAVDSAAPSDQIVVTNGVYPGRVAVTNPLALRSANGPQFTIINGGGTNRCASLTEGTSMTGFTLTNGWGDDSAGGVWCASTNAFLTNCMVVGNWASGWGGNGGGVCGGTLYKCTLSGNHAHSYDSAYGAYGGGAYGSTLCNCTLTGNSGARGGGAAFSRLYNCTLTENSGGWTGGGAYSSTLYNCTLTGNSGGGAGSSTLYNCTLTGNSGGGAWWCALYNSIVYFNTATSWWTNYDTNSTLNYCCTTPLPPGAGNISTDPRLTDVTHVSSNSPCAGAGSPNYTNGTDIDGEAWANPPSIGCDEFHAGPVTGPLTVSLAADYTNAAAGLVLNFTARISGHAFINFWDFDDGTFVINEPWGSPHSFATPGDYTVSLWAYNESYPDGVSASLVIHVDTNNLYYVSAASQNPVAPYTSWATAATNIQDAVDVAVAGGNILVTNGTYASGERALASWGTNRVVLDKPVTLCSVNGAPFTIVDGKQAIRCAYLANGAGINGFTLTNGKANVGGGVWSDSTGVVSNCVITGNSAIGFYGRGGGACGGTLYDCTLSGNSATDSGGGACGGTLYNCTLSGNSAASDYSFGGGAYSSTLNNCIVYFNTTGDYYDSTLNYCCTTPMPTNGVGNVTNTPLFVDYAGGDLRLQSNSPCINAGNNVYAPGPTDLDGNPRFVGGTVDIGAHEFQGAGSVISYAWLQQFGLPTDGSADFTDPDHDGLNNWQEWRCGTCPTNANSALRLLSPQRTGAKATVTWQSVAGVNYFLERSTSLAATPCFTCVATNLPGQPGTTSYTDTAAANAGPYFYRVGVGN